MSKNKQAIIDWSGLDHYPEKDGAYIHVDESLYHADRRRMSKHQLDTFSRSPAHWLAEREGRRPRKSTDAMSWGSALDMLVTDEARFADAYVVGPDVSRATKAWKTFVAQLGEHQVPIKGADYNAILGARDALRKHPIAKDYLFGDNVFHQITINWTWRFRGAAVPMRSRLDALFVKDDCIAIADLKRTIDAREEAFSKAAANYTYHVQQACYTMAVIQAFQLQEPPDFVFIAIEPDPDYGIIVHRLSQLSYELGLDIMHQTLTHYMRCAKEKHFPSYPEEICETQLPRWYFQQQSKRLEDMV